MPCSAHKDQYGTTYTIPAAETIIAARTGLRLRGYPEVTVWWSRIDKNAQESLIIRQEYEDRATADVLELTFGQAYDLIDALNQAVESS